MDCITFNKLIDDYIADELEDAQLNEFLQHLESCKDCAEELEINFIVREGVKILDQKNQSYDLSSAFRDDTKQNEHYIAARKKMIRMSYVCSTLAFWLVSASIVVFIRILTLGR